MTDQWESVRLGDVLTIKHGYAFSGMSESDDGALPIVVGIGNFDYAGGFRFEDTKLKRFDGDYPESFDLRAGDLLLAMTCQTPGGEILGVPGVIPDDGRKYLHNQRLGKVHIADEERIDLGYVYHLARTREFNQYLFATASGSKILHTSPKRIEDYEFRCPPLPAQRSIAATLGAFDDKIESNRRAIETGERLLRSKVLLAIDTSSGDEGVLSDYCGLVNATVKAGNIDPTANYIGFEHMPRGSVFLNAWTTAEGLGSHKAAFQSGDLLFGKLRPYFKKVGIAPVAGVCSTDILVIRPKNPRDLGLITCVGASDALIDSLSASSTGTRMPRASWNDLASWPVPKMTEAELEALADDVSPLIARLEALTFESQRLAALRDALLPELLSGSIRVPAEEAA